ncbi:related to n-alkane-inducible cytochrome P450 [Lecanosticta acicola]|uniref:Related to n-alkane-inducible cytochrome P450 n=1 Tax=Lecanosticta acicola TaxID=111012 RepID=A0AAI9EDC9_9PEZI|nr:related to n-alkane-inducible cytochrome P450 [Lecanosticta acicola]
MGLSTFLVDRISPWTVVYTCTTITVYALRHNVSDFLTYALFLGSTALFIRIIILHYLEESRILALGTQAPVIRTKTPFNTGFIAQALWYFQHHRNHELWWNLFSKANPNRPYTVETVVLGQRLVFTADEENIKAILATKFQDYGKGPQFRVEWKDFLGLSIFTTDGQQWHDSRTLLRPQFIKDRLSDLKTFEHHVQILLPMLEGSQAGATVRFDDLVYRYTLDAATDFLLGRSVESLQNGEAEFAKAFAEVQRVQAMIARAGLVRHLVPKKSFYEGLDVLNKFVDKYIDQALALPQEELEKKSKSDEGYTFLHAIATFTRDRAVLRDQLVAVLLAGRDTTATTLSWLFYELSRDPTRTQKLRQEIIDRVGLDREPTYEDLKSMRYLQHVLNEILRMYPVVPYNVRVALKDTTLPHGGGPDGTDPIGITEGTPIAYSTFILQRREDIYPPQSSGFPDHLKFVPERWDGWTPKSWTYIPFNGGPRICIGQQFALTEMAYSVTRILQTFERVEDRNQSFPGTKTDIVLQPANGVHVAFIKAKKA